MGKPKANGCLSVFFKGLVIIFLIGNVYAVVRMEWARIQVYRLAHQLDYSSANYLHGTVYYGGPNLVTGAARCYIALYYTTPMTATVYWERLVQIKPKAFDSGNVDRHYMINELGIDLLSLTDGNRDQPQDVSSIQPLSPVRWLIPNGNNVPIGISFQTLSPQEYRAEYQGKPITGNVVKFSGSGGIMQPWMMLGVLLWEKAHFLGL